MDIEMNYKETVQATEEAIKNTSDVKYFQPDNFNYKINDDFFYNIYIASHENKEFGLLFWFIKMMGKNNIIYSVIAKDMISKSEMSKGTYYKMLKRLIDNEVLIKLNKKTFMVNPNIIINHRKSTNKDRPQLLALWSEYKKQGF